jgi:signal transduction histidine kinase
MQTLSNPLPLGPQHQLPVLRIIQEGLTNALKHANAHTIAVEATNTATQFTLTIQDDGCGFDVQAAATQGSGKGLNSLEKRARVLGGTLRVESSAQGTLVELRVPLVLSDALVATAHPAPAVR